MWFLDINKTLIKKVEQRHLGLQNYVFQSTELGKSVKIKEEILFKK